MVREELVVPEVLVGTTVLDEGHWRKNITITTFVTKTLPILKLKYSGDLNTNHLNTGKIQIPNFLKFGFQMVGYSNGWMSYVLDRPFDNWTST